MDWAEEIRYLVNIMYPDAEKIILVMDNLNTHKPASLYKRFEPAEARRILRKLEIHYTPKHGSWLDIAEIELNIMTRQCLSRRIDSIETLGNTAQMTVRQMCSRFFVRSSKNSAGILAYVKGFLDKMTEKMQTDDVLSRQAVFVRCCL